MHLSVSPHFKQSGEDHVQFICVFATFDNILQRASSLVESQLTCPVCKLHGPA